MGTFHVDIQTSKDVSKKMILLQERGLDVEVFWKTKLIHSYAINHSILPRDQSIPWVYPFIYRGPLPMEQNWFLMCNLYSWYEAKTRLILEVEIFSTFLFQMDFFVPLLPMLQQPQPQGKMEVQLYMNHINTVEVIVPVGITDVGEQVSKEFF